MPQLKSGPSIRQQARFDPPDDAHRKALSDRQYHGFAGKYHLRHQTYFSSTIRESRRIYD
jgi:hypothetical protein